MSREAPDVSRLLTTLAKCDVQYVLAGSVAVEAWGVDIDAPGDLDIIPATDAANLRQLQHALERIQAQPFPVTGEWEPNPEGFVWRQYEHHDPRHGSTPPPLDPLNPGSFDSLYTTIHGALDIVPVISGEYAKVLPRATKITVHGIPDVPVLSIADLLAQLTVARRAKDVSRVTKLR